MPHTDMGAVAPLGVDTVELSHADTQIAFDSRHHDAEVLVHEAVGVTHPVETLADLAKEVEPFVPISIIQFNGLAPVATRSDVVQAAGDFNAQGS